MHAEVVSIGDELTSGERLDTNSQWLSERLGELGIRVLYHSTVGDDLEANVRVFREAFDRADFIICTGGLGPTADDLTRQALASATGRELVQDDTALAHIRALFARRQRPMPERNVCQALFPAGSSVIPNPHGTAPGVDIAVAREGRSASRLFALPGVPAEMVEMWTQSVEPALATATGEVRVIRHRRIKCFGVGESDLEQMLPDLIQRGRQPSVGITVSQATITLRITAAGHDHDECQAAIEPTAQTIYDCLGSVVFGEEDDELQQAVIRQLKSRGETVAVVEWGTGGLVADWLSVASGPDGPFRGGLVIGDRGALAALPAASPLADGVSPEERDVAGWAEACRHQFATDYAIAVGPFPSADGDGKEPGTLPIAVAWKEGAKTATPAFAGHPDILKARSGKQALNLLRLHLTPG